MTKFKLDSPESVSRHYHAGRKNCVKQVILKAVVPVTMLLMKQKEIARLKRELRDAQDAL